MINTKDFIDKILEQDKYFCKNNIRQISFFLLIRPRIFDNMTI